MSIGVLCFSINAFAECSNTSPLIIATVKEAVRENETTEMTVEEEITAYGEEIVLTTKEARIALNKQKELLKDEAVENEAEMEIVETEPQPLEKDDYVNPKCDGRTLNAYIGTVQGPSGKETYYNLDMTEVIRIMKENEGFDYEYTVREDGVKMYGPYIMCAANLEIRPKGTLVETSLGTAIVCDTGEFATYNKYQIDIAVDW